MFNFLLLSCFLLAFLFIFFKSKSKPKSNTNSSLKSYPIIGHYFSMKANRHRRLKWTTDLVHNSPTSTILLNLPFGQGHAFTGNPAVVEHILKTNFSNYEKGNYGHETLFDFLGNGIFNVDGDVWKSQRQLYSHVFRTKSLRYFVEHVVDTELNERLIPFLSAAAANDTVLDLQDIFQRFALDNICKIAFDYDPACLTPSLPPAKFADAFDDALRITLHRFFTITPIWKIKKFLNIGTEKQLKEAKSEIRGFTKKILSKEPSTDNLLARLISTGQSTEGFVTDVLINFIFAGRDTTPAALTWFFWLLSKNPGSESEILKEINEKLGSGSPSYDQVKEMVYTHASLCESMRLYPPVAIANRRAIADDILPDGTVVKKGMSVGYHAYAMGRSEKLWGGDWMEFRPERWLEKDEKAENVRFKERDPYTYPVFQGGPRICMGKDMSFFQMKKVVADVLRRFKVVPVMDDGREPVYITIITSKMGGGFPVRIKERK